MKYVENCYFDPNRNIYPVNLENLQDQYPKTSFPETVNSEFLAFLGLVRVVEVNKPINVAVTHDVVEGTPVKNGDEFYQNWIVTPVALSAQQVDERIAAAKVALCDALSTFRFNLEVGGISVDGVTVKTDRESQAQLTAALLTLNEGFAPSINWKSASGWINLNKAQLQQISKIVAQHVQGCFNVEQMHYSAIQKLASAEEVAAYDFTLGWPTNQY